MALATVGTNTAQFVGAVTVDPSNIPGNNTSVETFTLNGLSKDGVVVVSMPDLEAGCVLLNAYCATTNVLTLVIENVTGAAINPASQSIKVVQI